MIEMLSKRLDVKPVNSTEFQTHKNHMKIDDSNHIIDFTEFKLLKMIKESINDKDKKTALLSLMSKYKDGKIIIAWRAGEWPIYTFL